MSPVEASTNVAVGYGLAVLVQVVVFPLFGLYPSLADNLLIGALFTGVSLVRSYLSHPGRLYGCFLNSSGLILYQSFMACNGDLLPRADCGSCWL